MSQLELFAQPDVAVSAVPTIDSVRARLESLLATLRAASVLPWSGKETAKWKLVVPQMADWLPADEQRSVRVEFAALVERLEISTGD